MGSHVTNTWQETHIAVESVMEVAERRHQEVMHGMAAVAEQSHRAEVAQLTGEAVSALGEQAKGHVHATEQLRREAAFFQDDITTYVSNLHAGENHAWGCAR